MCIWITTEGHKVTVRSLLPKDSIPLMVSSYITNILQHRIQEYPTQKFLWTNILLCQTSDSLRNQEYWPSNQHLSQGSTVLQCDNSKYQLVL
jgi:hypothetical protein